MRSNDNKIIIISLESFPTHTPPPLSKAYARVYEYNNKGMVVKLYDIFIRYFIAHPSAQFAQYFFLFSLAVG